MAADNSNDRAAWLQGPFAQCALPPQPNQFPWRLVLLGAPGVGKGTQSDLLNRRLGACHLSTGDVFRAAGSRREEEQSPAIKKAMEIVRSGRLVPDSTVWEMIHERSKCLRCGGGFILDGFPRTIGQAESLRQWMVDEGMSLTAVVNYELSAEEVLMRLSGRRTCEQCQAVFHLTEHPAKVAGWCDRCGGKLFQREDDRRESIVVRLESYERSTTPLIEFYERLGLLVRIDATRPPDEICASTLASLRSSRAQQLGQET